MGKPAAIGTAAAIATLALLSAPSAHAQEPAAGDGAPGFGERGSVLFSVENVFGVLDQTYSAGNGNNSTNTSLNDNGFFPQGFVGTRIGINGLLSSGITLGGIVGVWNDTSTNQNGGSFTSVNIGPRFGWAGCLKKYKALGFWGRVGPTFQYVNFSETIGNTNASVDAWALDLSFEAFIVWSPVDHFGLLAGPNVDIGLTGHESSQNTGADFGYHAVGMSFGLVFEL
ncbi:MAG TPA: hypothetical protein VMI75_08195 [Polyangiaceae bacterium]|nr:hypothetical protein [Polyangiaceae bacterium]